MNHGTSTAYNKGGCRCEVCKRWRMRHGIRYRMGVAANGPSMVSVEIVRAHVRELVASGWTQVAIAAEIGRTPQALWSVLNNGNHGVKRWMRRDIAAQIFELEPLEPVEVDEVVVLRLLEGADWRAIGATRAERIAAAELIPVKADAERRLGLHQGRDFARQQVAS